MVRLIACERQLKREARAGVRARRRPYAPLLRLDEALAYCQADAESLCAASMIRGLSDEQLDRTATLFAGSMTAQQMIEGILISHVAMHLESIRSAAPA